MAKKLIGYQAGSMESLETDIYSDLGLYKNTGLPSSLTISFTGDAAATADEYLVLNGITYKFTAVAGAYVAVTAGASGTASATNLAAAINANDTTLYAYTTSSYIVYIYTKIPSASAISKTTTNLSTAVTYTESTGCLASSLYMLDYMHALTGDDVNSSSAGTFNIFVPMNNVTAIRPHLRAANFGAPVSDTIVFAVTPGELLITSDGSQPSAADTVTIGGTVYEYRATTAAATAGTVRVQIDVDTAAATHRNLCSAIKNTQPALDVTFVSNTVIRLCRKNPAGAAIACSESCSHHALHSSGTTVTTALRNTKIAVNETSGAAWTAGQLLHLHIVGY